MSDHYINYKNIRMHYRKAGSGPFVLLIHGFGEDGEIWKGQEAFLKDQFTLIIPDIPGSGKSEFLEQGNIADSHLIGEYARVLHAIVDAESIGSCSIIGHSMGGYIALAFAAFYPEKVKSLGLFHSTAFADSEEKKEARRKGIAFIEKHGAYEFLKQSIPNLFGERFAQLHSNTIKQLIESAANFSSESLVQYYKAMMERPDRIDILKKIPHPVLFIIGEDDKSVYLQDSLRQSYLPDKSLINIYPGVAHMGMLEVKDQTNATVMKFLNYSVNASCN